MCLDIMYIFFKRVRLNINRKHSYLYYRVSCNNYNNCIMCILHVYYKTYNYTLKRKLLTNSTRKKNIFLISKLLQI